MSENLSNDFEKIVSISETMLEHARQERWDDVTSFEQERKELLATFFSKPLNKMQNVNLSCGIRIILEKDREIVRLGSAKRDKLRNALQKFNQRKDVVEAYSAVG